MAVEVEIYDQLETMEMTMAGIVDTESLEIIEAMGLEGQKKLLKPQENGEINRNPYASLTEDQRFVCGHLFPKYTLISQFTDPIPYRVLKEAQVAKSHFKNLYILHEAPAVVKDPVLVGTDFDYYYWAPEHQAQDYYNRMSLIARWGSALAPWEELMKQAAKVANEKLVSYLAVMKQSVDMAVTMAEKGVRPTNRQFNPNNMSALLPYTFN